MQENYQTYYDVRELILVITMITKSLPLNDLKKKRFIGSPSIWLSQPPQFTKILSFHISLVNK